jgi:hypothetical protein
VRLERKKSINNSPKSIFTHHLLQWSRRTRLLRTRPTAHTAVLMLKTPIVVLYTLRRRVTAHRGTGSTNICCLRLFESLIFAIGSIAVLDDQRRSRHLSIVRVLFVPAIVVLNQNGRGAFLVLLLELLSTLVRPIRLLDALGRFVEFTLFAVGECEVRKVRLKRSRRRIGRL